LDDAFAKSLGAEDVEKLKVGVRNDLENELKYSQAKSVRGQVIRELLNRVNFDLPESAVAAETRNAVYDIVNQNTRRGVPRDTIELQKNEIYSAAASSAKERVKLAFIVQKIAEKEDVKVSQEDALKRAQSLAMMNQVPFEQFIKDLQKRNGVNELYEQVLHEKVLEILEKNAKIEEVPPAQG
jgi:trigger factor